MNLIVFIVGMFVGGLLYFALSERKHVSGEFIIDFTDPMKDVCTFVLFDDINRIYEQERILLDVKVYDNSQN